MANKKQPTENKIRVACESRSALPLSELKDFQGGLKTLSPDNLDKLKRSILKHGIIAPALVWKSGKTNYILDAHQRKKAFESLQEEGYTIPQIPVVFVQAKNKKEAKEILLKISSQYGDFDQAGFVDFTVDLDLDSLLPDIALSDFDVPLPQEETAADDVLPEDVPVITKTGDLWELGKHRLLCGDSTDSDCVGRLMWNKKVDMFFTDPPYGVSYGDKNKFLNKYDKGNRIQTNIENDHLSAGECSAIWVAAFSLFVENASDYSSYYICSPQGGELFMLMMQSIQNAGLQLKHQIIWVKNNHVLGRTDYNYKHEPIFYGWHKKHQFFGNGQQKFSVWNFNKPHSSNLHPTMKPVELIENAILNSTQSGNNIIFDPFLGSGSTLIAAEKTNRSCYGMEIDPHYCDVIVQRYIDWCTTNGRTPSVKRNGKVYKK